jgi:hypothetical protein
VAAGGSHTCTLLTDGAIQCWGDNRVGQLGDGSTVNRLLPTAVASVAGAQLTIGLDSQKDHIRNFQLVGSGAIGVLLLDDVTQQDDDAYDNSHTLTVAPGRYTVTANEPPGWFLSAITCDAGVNATIDLPNKQVTVDLAATDQAACQFVMARGGKVQAALFTDLNGSGNRQQREPWNSGWQVDLFDHEQLLVASAPTNSTGKVIFVDLPPGDYVLCEQLQGGLTHPQPCQPITVSPATTTFVLFANRVDAAAQPSAAATAITVLPDGADVATAEAGITAADLQWLQSDEAVEIAASEQQLFLPLLFR